MGVFERYLSIWVGLAILAGILAGSVTPGYFSLIAQFEYAQVNLVFTVLILLMS